MLKELEEIETVLEQELKELDECFQLASRLLTQIQDQTFKLINDKIYDTGENAENVVVNAYLYIQLLIMLRFFTAGQ